MSYSVLFFDADNTLFDFDRSQDWALRETIQGLCGRLEPGWLETYKIINARLWAAFERHEISVIELKQKRFESFVEAVDFVNQEGFRNY